MYHCHIQFYLMGPQRDIWWTIRAIPPLEPFTHAFSQSETLDPALAADADVIIADLRDLEAGAALVALADARKPGAELLLLAREEQVNLLAEYPEEVADIWTGPLNQVTLGFRFRKWQEAFRREKDLWQAGHFLDAVIDGSPNMIWFKTRDGIHEKVNTAFCQVVGKTREEAEGATHARIWNVEHDDPACIESEEEVMRRRETCKAEETIQTGEGEKRLTTYKSPLYDLDGSVMGTVGVGIDVTRERAYKQEILQKSQTLEMLFSTMDCGVMCHSMDGRRLISINEAALRLLGYGSQEEMLADGFQMVAQSVVDEDKGKLRECIQSLTKVGESASTEYRVQHKDGKVLDILGNVKLIEENGERLCQRFLLDFTAYKRKDAEKLAQKDAEIKYQEQMLETFSTFLSDKIDDVYLMFDAAQSKAEFISANVERVLGISQQDLLEDLRTTGSPRYLTAGREVSLKDLAAMEPGDSLETLETERVNPRTGEHKWFLESVYCVQLQGRKRIIVYISDRTKERKAQDTMREALEMAQMANKAKSTFLSNVSHDIRTPMNAIMGFVALLREEADNPEHILEYTQKISSASQHLLGLINDVLDMNKIESGSTVLNISELNMAEIVEEMNTIIRPQARAKEQEFEVYTTALANEHLLGDKLRINQILINILSNAVKYTPCGGRIEMRVRELPQMDPKYSRLRFTISDNGQGMSEDYLQVIFDPFTREQSTLVNKIQGTGLGMAITKSLVDLMHGSIKVESKLGEGSTFTVNLDLRIQEREDDPAFWGRHRIMRMIVADDDEDICRDILKKMAGTGVSVHYATNGTQAIEMMRSARERGEPYDLMLLDWKMPGLDGLETARLIRKNYPHKIPILLFTAYDWVDIEQEATEVGIDHFLPKPFFMCSFKDAIQRMAASKKKPEAAAKSIMDGKRILVVDDIEVNRMILVKILTTLGAVCDVAENGQEALDRFMASQPGEYDIIFMDIQMPVMNGYEATKAIRASGHPSALSIAIIAMTANAFVDDIREALESGMDAHIPKPIVLDQLKSTVQDVLERKDHCSLKNI